MLGVVGAVALWLIAGKRYDDAVGSLAPAPIGCDTTLVFDRTGTYTFFVETKGSVGEIDGDCDNDDRSYDLDSADVPDVELTLLDEEGRGCQPRSGRRPDVRPGRRRSAPGFARPTSRSRERTS